MKIVCVSTINWDFLFQRPQQIVARLASRGHSFIFIEPSPPLFRVIRAPSMLLPKIGHHNVLLVKNLTISKGDKKIIRSLIAIFNVLLLTTLIYIFFRKTDFWLFYFPDSFILQFVRKQKIAYDCVDDLSNFPDISQKKKLELINNELNLIGTAKIVFATSWSLYERNSKINPNTAYVPNACDFEHFYKALQIKEQPHDIQQLRYPIIGFIGAIREWIDIDLICKIAEEHPEYSILLVGPVTYGYHKLKKYKNISMVGTKEYRVLPQYLAFMDVCLIPFKVNKLTIASNPIKLYEYLAAGKPVVSVALPEIIIKNASSLVRVAQNGNEFIKQIQEAVNETKTSENNREIFRRVSFAKRNSWEKRIDTIEKLLRSISAPKS